MLMNRITLYMRLLLVIVTGLVFYSFMLAKKNRIKNEEVVLHRFMPSECITDMDAYHIRDRVVSKKLIADSLFLTIGFKEHCCPDFDPHIVFRRDTLFITRLENPSSAIRCECHCCFEMTLVLTGIKDTGFVVLLQDEKIAYQTPLDLNSPVKFEIENGDTINCVNILGYPFGEWRIYDSLSHKLSERIFLNGKTGHKLSDVYHVEKYYPSGELKSISRVDSGSCFYAGDKSLDWMSRLQFGFIYHEYYENGQISKMCRTHCFDDETFIDSCQYWNEQGLPINP